MRYFYSIFIVFFFLAPSYSQTRDTCFSSKSLDSLVNAVHEVVRRNMLLDRTVSTLLTQTESLKNSNVALHAIVSGHEELEDRSMKVINDLQATLGKTEKKLRREKGLRWLWAGAGAGVVVGIIALVK